MCSIWLLKIVLVPIVKDFADVAVLQWWCFQNGRYLLIQNLMLSVFVFVIKPRLIIGELWKASFLLYLAHVSNMNFITRLHNWWWAIESKCSISEIQSWFLMCFWILRWLAAFFELKKLCTRVLETRTQINRILRINHPWRIPQGTSSCVYWHVLHQHFILHLHCVWVILRAHLIIQCRLTSCCSSCHRLSSTPMSKAINPSDSTHGWNQVLAVIVSAWVDKRTVYFVLYVHASRTGIFVEFTCHFVGIRKICSYLIHFILLYFLHDLCSIYCSQILICIIFRIELILSKVWFITLLAEIALPITFLTLIVHQVQRRLFLCVTKWSLYCILIQWIHIWVV